MPTGPLGSLVDCFVSELTGCGVSEIERSLCAHRLHCGDESEAALSETLSKFSPSSSPLGNGARMQQRKEELIASDLVHQYETMITRKVQALSVARRTLNRAPQLRRATASGAARHQPLFASPALATLDDPAERAFAEGVDLEDALRHLSDEAVLSMTLQHTSSRAASENISFGCFVYIMSRVFARTALLEWPREAILQFLSELRTEGFDDLVDPAAGVVMRLLHCGRKLATALFISADVNHVWLVPWSALTTALVDYTASINDHPEVPASPSRETGGGDITAGRQAASSTTSTNAQGPRIGHYDRYDPCPFPRSKLLQQFPGAMAWVHDSPLVIIEGRADQCAVVHRDDFSLARHYLTRHRADPTKIAASSILFAQFLDTSITTLIVAETDMNVYCYDLGPKRRKHLEPWVILKAPFAITTCTMTTDHRHLLIGTRTGSIFVVNPTDVMVANVRAPQDNEPVRLQLEVVAERCVRVSSQAITGVSEAAPSVILVSTLDGLVTVFSGTWIRIRNFEADTSGIKFLVGDRSSERFVTCSLDGTLTVWLSAHGVNRVVLSDPQVPHLHRIDWVFLDRDFQQLLTVDYSGLVKIWDLGRLTLIRTFFALSDRPANEFLSARADVVPHEISSDIFPLQSFTVDWNRRKIYGRGHHNEFSAAFVDGTKKMKAHPGPVRHILQSGSVVLSACGKRICLWSRAKGVQMACEWSSDDPPRVGEMPPLMRHQQQFGLGDAQLGQTDTLQSRSELLHRALEYHAQHNSDSAVVNPGDAAEPLDEVSTTANKSIGVSRRDVCAACVDSAGTQLFIALSDGTISSHLIPSGRCLKVFTAHRIVRQSRGTASPDASPRRRGGPSFANRRGSTGDFNGGRSCGYSLEALSMCYLDADRLIVVYYSDGAIRYFSDEGASRASTHHQLAADENDASPVPTVKATSPGATTGPTSTRMRSASKVVAAMLQLSKSTVATLSSSVGRQMPGPLLSTGDADDDLNNSVSSSGSGAGGAPQLIGSVSSGRLRLIAASFTGGVVKLFDITTHLSVVKVIHEFRCTSEVSTMTFLCDFPCLAVGTSSGAVELFLVRGASLLSLVQDLSQDLDAEKRRRTRSGSVVRAGGSAQMPQLTRRRSGSLGGGSGTHRPIAGATTRIPSDEGPVTCMQFSTSDALLVCGLADGRVQCHSLIHFVVALGLNPITGSLTHDLVLAGREHNRVTQRQTRFQRLVSHITTPPTADDWGAFSQTSDGSFMSNSRHCRDTDANLFTPRVPPLQDESQRLTTPETITSLPLVELLLCAVIQNLVDFALEGEGEMERQRCSAVLFRKCRMVDSGTAATDAASLSLSLDLSPLAPISHCIQNTTPDRRPSLMDFGRRMTDRLLQVVCASQTSTGSLLLGGNLPLTSLSLLGGGGLMLGGTAAGDVALLSIGTNGVVATLNCAISVADALMRSRQLLSWDLQRRHSEGSEVDGAKRYDPWIDETLAAIQSNHGAADPHPGRRGLFHSVLAGRVRDGVRHFITDHLQETPPTTWCEETPNIISLPTPAASTASRGLVPNRSPAPAPPLSPFSLQLPAPSFRKSGGFTRSPRTASFIGGAHAREDKAPATTFECAPRDEEGESDDILMWGSQKYDSVLENSAWIQVIPKREKIRVVFPKSQTALSEAALSSARVVIPEASVEVRKNRPNTARSECLRSPRHPRVPVDVHMRYGVGSRPSVIDKAVVDRSKHMPAVTQTVPSYAATSLAPKLSLGFGLELPASFAKPSHAT